MDPNKTLADMVAELRAPIAKRKLFNLWLLAGYLRTWIAQGGFVPDAVRERDVDALVSYAWRIVTDGAFRDRILAKHVARTSYAWPGGYAMFGITGDGALLCPKCIAENWREIVQAPEYGDDAWRIIGATHRGEFDPDVGDCCVHCYKHVAEF